MSLLGSLSCFVIGTYAELSVLSRVIQGRFTHTNSTLLNIDSLDSLKQKLTKVIIVALIVTAFKLMVSFEVNTISELLQYCGGVLMLAFSS